MKKFDVAIAGAGLIGGSIALELARAGLRVGLFDRQEPGQESSWAGAGILSPAPESSSMIPLVPLAKASMAIYPEFVSMVEEISGQNAGYRPKGTLQAIFNRDAREELSTVIALHHGLGLKAEPLNADDARAIEPSLSEDLEAAVLRPDEGSIDNRAFTRAVLEAAHRSGVQFYPGSGAEAICRERRRCTGLQLKNENIEARWTVIAAGCFSASIQGAAAYAPVRPAKGQIAALRAGDLQIERVLW
jgi:glycine oxidase